jgi:hypothetical protein
MVTHSSTSRPVQCLCMAERTGCPVFTDLWSYVLVDLDGSIMSLVVASGALLERKRGAVGLGSRRTKDLGSSSQKSLGHCSTQEHGELKWRQKPLSSAARLGFRLGQHHLLGHSEPTQLHTSHLESNTMLQEGCHQAVLPYPKVGSTVLYHRVRLEG